MGSHDIPYLLKGGKCESKPWLDGGACLPWAQPQGPSGTGRQSQAGPSAKLTLWKGGQWGSCIFNSCIVKGISAGLICVYTWRTWGNPLFITTVKAAGALPSFKSGHACRATAALSVVMEREISPGSPRRPMTPAEITCPKIVNPLWRNVSHGCDHHNPCELWKGQEKQKALTKIEDIKELEDFTEPKENLAQEHEKPCVLQNPGLITHSIIE